MKVETTREALATQDEPLVIPEPTMSKTVLPQYFETLPALKQLDEGYAAIHAWQFESGALSLIEEGDVYNVFVQTPYPSRGDAYADCALCQQFVNALEAVDVLQRL